ncbi:AP-2 complex subunit mu [Linum grandiflorum]
MPVAASALYFLNLRGDVLINRLYRDDVGGNMVDAFRMHIMQTKELGTCPVRQIGGCSFFYMRISNVYIVVVVSSNANVACAFKFVVEAVALFKSYFGGAFDEDAIRNNFVLIYELLDEIMDFGYPQNLSPEILKLYITQEGVRSPFSSKQALDKPVPNATLQVTGAVGWRREGLVYKKNEVSLSSLFPLNSTFTSQLAENYIFNQFQVFLDIVESVNLLMSSKGSVLRCDVTGKILMKCFLSGMPDLKLGLNDKIGLEKESQLKNRPTKSGKTIELDDVTFHQCVNLTRFNSEKTVSFVPPDGEFELMKYRITEGVNLPFRVLPTIKEHGRTRMEVNVKVKSVFGAKMFALGVVIKIPVPKQTAKTSFQVTSGRAKYNASIDCLVWKIKKFPGQTEPTLSAEVELISTIADKKSWTRPPIQMEFQVPMFTASGLRVRFLKVWEKSGYNTVEWVRYITKAGSYEIRC